MFYYYTCSKKKAILLDYHIIRLKNCVKKLYLNICNWNKIVNDINYLAKSNKKKLAVIKVIITRGKSNRGYQIINCNKCTVIMMLSDYPNFYLEKQKIGVNLILSNIPINNNPFLSKIKHLNRLEQILIKREIDYSCVDEAIVFDKNGIIIGCCASNIFFRKERYVFTPNIECSGVKGVMRKKIIEYLLKNNYFIFYVQITFDFLFYFDEVFITNSLMPILSVNKIFINSKERGVNFYSKKLFNFLLPYCLNLK